MGANSFRRRLQAERPVIRVQTPAGEEAWRAPRHAEIRKLLLDPRLGRSHPDPGNAPKYVDNPMMDYMRLEIDFASEPEVHHQHRVLLAPYFSSRNMGARQPCVGPTVDEAASPRAS